MTHGSGASRLVRGGRLAALAKAVVVTLVAAGCGSSGGGSTTTGSGSDTDASTGGRKLTTVKVGVLAIGTQVPLYIGIERGFFRDEGLRVKTQVMAGGSVVLPAMMQGSVQFGFMNGATVVFGAARGLPLQVVAGGEGAPTRGHRDEDLSRLVVARGSPIRSPKDLEGKTISVSGLRDAPELLTRAALAERGVDVTKLRFSEVPYTDALAALSSGRVDASYLVTPFGEQAEKEGARTIVRPYYDTQPGLATAYYGVSKPYAEQHSDVVAAFQRAMLKSEAYANDHVAEARALLPSFTKIPADIIPKVNFGSFPTTLQQASESLGLLARLMTRYGWIDSPPDVDAGTLVFSPDGAR